MLTGNKILLGKGIGQIRFGMLQNDIESILGKASKEDEFVQDQETNLKTISLHYEDANLSFNFDEIDDFKLTGISVNSNKYSLRDDVMIGMRKQTLLDVLDMLNMTDYATEDMGTLESPNLEVVTIDGRSVNFWFDHDLLTEIQWWPLFDEDENPIWPDLEKVN